MHLYLCITFEWKAFLKYLKIKRFLVSQYYFATDQQGFQAVQTLLFLVFQYFFFESPM